MDTLTLNKKELLHALKRAAAVIQKNPPLPILDSFLFDVEEGLVRITATSLEQTIQVIAPFVGETGTIERFCIEAAPFLKLIENCSDQPINVELSETHITVIIKDGEYTFPILPPTDFPEIPNYTTRDEYFFCHSDDFLTGMKRVSYAIGTDGLRPAMMHILQQTETSGASTFIATDAHRMAKVWANEFTQDQDSRIGFYSEKDEAIKCLWSSSAMKALAKFLSTGPMMVVKAESFLFVEQGNEFFAFQQLDVAFPNTEGLVPSIPERLESVQISEITAALDRLSVITTGEAMNVVKLTFQSDKLMVHARNEMGDMTGQEYIEYFVPDQEEDIGDEIVKPETRTEKKGTMSVAVNIKALLQAIENLKHQHGIVQFQANGSSRPLVLTSWNDDDQACEIHMLMPINLS